MLNKNNTNRSIDNTRRPSSMECHSYYLIHQENCVKDNQHYLEIKTKYFFWIELLI